MHTLQDVFEKQFQEQFKFSGFAATLIEKEMEKKGIQLTKKQNEQLAEGLQKKVDEDTISEGLSIQIDDDGTLRVTNKTGTSDSEIDISGAAETKVNKIIENLPTIIDKSSDSACDALLQDIKKRKSTLLGEHRKDQKRFNKHLNNKWGELLNLLEAFILLSEEAGAEFNGFIRGDSEKEYSPRFEVLSRSHARSCQVALEILVLLQQGFADGAHARWRTLHEIAVECFIINKGNDNLAIRYLDYDIVQKRKYAKVYQDHFHEINYEHISDDDMQRLDNDYKKLIEIYGNDFPKENGWAT